MVYKVPFVNYPKHYRRMWNDKGWQRWGAIIEVVG